MENILKILVSFVKTKNKNNVHYPGLEFAVFGLGNSLYQDHYNTVGRELDKFLYQLSATRMHPLGLGDENVAGCVFITFYGNQLNDC